MVTTIKITRIWIEHIEKIEVEDITLHRELGSIHKTLNIWTKEGDKIELVLEADSPEQLEFRKSEWLTPKVYKGKSMHEEEEG